MSRTSNFVSRISKMISRHDLQIEEDLIDLCEDNDEMKQAIRNYFQEEEFEVDED